MGRWRLVTVALVVLALVLWGLLFIFNLRPEMAHELPPGLPGSPGALRLQAPLSHLPPWASSLELFVTLLLAGVGSLFLFPVRMRNMSRALATGWSRLVVIDLLGIGFGLLIIVFGIGAALARITFPFTVLAALAIVFLAAWGFLASAYTLGRLLLAHAAWRGPSPILELGLGLLLLLPLARIPIVGGIVMIIYIGLGLGLAITTRFGSGVPWSLIPLLEDANE